MSDEPRLSSEDLEAEAGTALPNKEVISLLDLNIDLDAALDLAAPIDLAVAANANVAAPINAAVSANVLSIGSESAAMATPHGAIDQGISGEAIANAPQDSSIDQGNDVIDDGGTAVPPPPTGGTGGVTAPTPSPEALLDGDDRTWVTDEHRSDRRCDAGVDDNTLIRSRVTWQRDRR